MSEPRITPERLRLHAFRAESPLGDDLNAAADTIETLTAERDEALWGGAHGKRRAQRWKDVLHPRGFVIGVCLMVVIYWLLGWW